MRTVSQIETEDILFKIRANHYVFCFDWKDEKTYAESEKNVSETELSISPIMKKSELYVNQLPQKERYKLGQIFYRLGTFYLYIKHEAAYALKYLILAEPILMGTEGAWAKLHLAYIEQQRLFVGSEHETVTLEKANTARQYCNEIMTRSWYDTQDTEVIKLKAYAYYIKARVDETMSQLEDAIIHCGMAIKLYEKHHLSDTQYINAKNLYTQLKAPTKPKPKTFTYLSESLQVIHFKRLPAEQAKEKEDQKRVSLSRRT